MPDHEMPPLATSLENQSTFCELNNGIPKQVALSSTVELLADLGEKKVFFTVAFSMTTLFNLIAFCLRCFLAPLLGFSKAFQPAALVLRAQAAINNVALLTLAELTPAHPIHAPTLLAPA